MLKTSSTSFEFLSLCNLKAGPEEAMHLRRLVNIIRQYGFWSFQMGDTKLERFLAKNQHTQRKLLNFENWVSGEVSKIEHHFSK